MGSGCVDKIRGPMPSQSPDGSLHFSAEGFKDADIYRAVAGRAKIRADYYCDYVRKSIAYDDPNLAINEHLEIYVTWAALACEVYLKSILFHNNAEEYYNLYKGETKKIINKHKLYELFNKIRLLDNKHNTDYSVQISNGIDEFDEKLKVISLYFQEYRYDYEMLDESFNCVFVFKLMERLRSITDKIDFLKSIEVIRQDDNPGLCIR